MRLVLALLLGVCVATLLLTPAPSTRSISIRGHEETLYLYGPRQGTPIIISSGDGGWIHLAPHVAEFLSEKGYFIIGFDVKHYLSSFTTRNATLQVREEPRDYGILADFALRTTGKKPILMGVSEGAGLSVLAATDPQTKAAIAGVIALGLPDVSELGWRWTDSLIYLTHKTPNEPTFSAAAIVSKVAPIPLAAIHSSHDEFVPASEVQQTLRNAGDPHKLWIVKASDHRFSDNLAEFDQHLLQAIEWVIENRPH